MNGGNKNGFYCDTQREKKKNDRNRFEHAVIFPRVGIRNEQET
jgi:hypothetical protein